VRRPSSGWPRRFQDRSIRSRRAHVPAAGQDALTGDLARPDDSPGPHRLYRPGAATHGGGPAEERRRALPQDRGVRGRRSFAGWPQKNGATLGGDGTRIAVAGDSAGGNLAAALVIKARDEGVSPPQATVLLAPITDFFFEQHESFERLAPLGIVYDTAFIGFIRGAYLVHGKNWAHPHASPAR